ncbi:hypothetical protein IAR55_003050 [Kwoniella newhampshirensis]|uniref:Ankyrin repeat protein n=1 Tax=Kwoniella newhampshirensis TaxID=1651941 RepID=A0AAW0Z1H4_9TREE
MRSTLSDLPVELIQQIHLLALNPFLPQTSTCIYSILHHPSPSFVATYVLALYSDYGPNEILVRALRHPVCTVEVAKDVRRIWDKRRGYIAPTLNDHPQHLDKRSDDDRHRSRSTSSPSPVRPTAPPLSCRELPRRLFRPSSSSPSAIYPLIRYLFDNYSPSPNSHKGYPLCRAAITSNYDLASYLLGKGADPSLKGCLAVDVAISNKDIKMVRLLVERDPTDTLVASPINSDSRVESGESKMGAKRAKKVKLDDRIRIGTNMVEAAMKKGSKEIVNYFVYEKKVMPPLQSIMKLSKAEPVKAFKSTKRKTR